MKSILHGLLAISSLAIAGTAAAQTTVVTFDAGWEGWNAAAKIEATGGNPGAHPHFFIQSTSIGIGTDTHPDFIGDHSAHENVTIGIDVKTESLTSTTGNPLTRSLVVDFRSYSLAAPGGVWASVWIELTELETGQDWATYTVSFDPNQTTLPPGWGGSGAKDPETGELTLPEGVTFADVMANVEEIEFTTAVPGYFYAFSDFNVRMDNLRIEKGAAPVVIPRYEVIDLGDFGGELANAHSINNAGHVVGTAEAENLEALPFLWRNGNLIDIGTLVPDASSGHGIARAISDNGYVAGYSMAPYPDGPGTVAHAFFWSEATGMIDIAPGSIMTGAWGINSAGKVVGDMGGPGGGAFVWSQTDGMTMISLPGAPAGFSNMAEDINENGFVCGHQWNVDFDYVGWVYDSDAETIEELETLGGTSETRAINDAGDVVGASARPNNQRRPVMWTADRQLVDLGFLPVPDFTQGIANAINNQRWIVGSDSYDGNGVPNKGWLWIEGKKVELLDLIDDPAQQAEWDDLSHPMDINERGEIVGIGVRNGVPGRAFLMRPIGGDDTIFASGFELR